MARRTRTAGRAPGKTGTSKTGASEPSETRNAVPLIPEPKGNRMANSFDLRCPKCGSTDEIDVSAPIWARLTDDGTDSDLAQNGGHEWDDDSPARCAACCHSGKVGEFQSNEYMAYFRTTAGPADDIFAADTPEQALELARKAFAEDPRKFGFSPADCGFLELQEIRIVNDDARRSLFG